MIYLLCDILVRSLSENLNFISYYFSYNISVLFVLYFISSVPLFLQDQNDIHILINEEEAMEINETVHHKIRPDLNMPLCDEVSTTKFEVLLMILHFMLRHGITDVAIKDFLKLINSIFKDKKVVETEYSFRSIFKTKLKPDFHFYCSNCNTYLREHFNPTEKRCEQNIKCPICNTDCDISKMNNGHFFITFSIEEQIRTLYIRDNRKYNGIVTLQR